jgi:phosphate transport system substrate-binding protein
LEQPNFCVSVTDAAPADAYPIVATSFVLVRTRQSNPARAESLRGFFRWALEQGQDMAENASYLPLPATLVQQVEASWGEHKSEAVARLH